VSTWRPIDAVVTSTWDLEPVHAYERTAESLHKRVRAEAQRKRQERERQERMAQGTRRTACDERER